MSEIISGDAGRIGFLPKGDYNENTTYNFLDVVYYNKSSYVAKKETKGNAPAANNEFWQIFAGGSESSEINTKTSDGAVKKGADNPNSAWTTDEEGNPAWRDIFAKKNIYGDTTVNLGRKPNTTIGANSHTEGRLTTASGAESHAEGGETVASGAASHAEGYKCESSGAESHAGGVNSVSYGFVSFSHGNIVLSIDAYTSSFGSSNIAAGFGSSVENVQNISGSNIFFKISSYDSDAKTFFFDKDFYNFTPAFSHLEIGKKIFIINKAYINDGYIFTISSIDNAQKSIVVEEDFPTVNFNPYTAALIKGNSNNQTINSPACHAEGARNIACGKYSHVEGSFSVANGDYSHAGGYSTVASGTGAHTEGCDNKASGRFSHAEGGSCKASGDCAHAEGISTTADGDYSHAEGHGTTALDGQHVQGHYNDQSLALAGSLSGAGSGTAFCIGNGTNLTASNAARIDYNGKLWCKQAYSSTGADYSELFEWYDGNPYNEDRRGYFVTMDGDKIKKASGTDYILGIISGNPSVIGNSDMEWYGQFMRDEFGTFIKENRKETIVETDFDEDGNPIEVEKEVDVEFYKVNPDYNPDVPYTFRLDRPEWDAVGMLGVLSVYDDGSCQVNRYCKCGNDGIATASDKGYRVIARLQDNIIKVVFR